MYDFTSDPCVSDLLLSHTFGSLLHQQDSLYSQYIPKLIWSTSRSRASTIVLESSAPMTRINDIILTKYTEPNPLDRNNCFSARPDVNKIVLEFGPNSIVFSPFKPGVNLEALHYRIVKDDNPPILPNCVCLND